MRSGINGAWANRPSIAKNAASSTYARTHQRQRRDRAPAGDVRADDPEHQDRQPERRRDRAREVEVPLAPLGTARDDVALGQDGRDQADRDVDEQDPAPAQKIGEHAAEEHAGGAAGASHRAPDADRAVAGRALLERGREDRQRSGGDDRAAEALHPARGDQQELGVGESAGERGEREQRQPGDEHAPAPDQVSGAAAEQQEAGERDRVSVDDPLQVLLGEVQRVADRGERDVHHGDVEDHHELRQAAQQQRGAKVWAFG